jgi:transcriptional regulator with GAF, ATPase, and Fis domain
MVTLNCAALPESLMEAELFGYEKGAFTGAVDRKAGKIEAADGGTLFLDEIGEMSPGMQAKLLRVLQEGIFYRVGGNVPISVDIRIISATNRDIDQDVSDGNFREDLFYRLDVVRIRVPPLRERREDIPLIARHYLDLFKRERGLHDMTVSQAAMDQMLQYEWPGNVRELRNAVERAVVMGNDREVLPEDLPIGSPRREPAPQAVGLPLKEAVDQFKKQLIVANLRQTGGNRARASKILGIQRTYLSRLISRYGIQDV